MSRRTALRFLLPVLLVTGAVAAWLTLRPAPGPDGPTDEVESGAGTQLRGFTFTDFEGGKRRLRVRARLGSFDAQGGFWWGRNTGGVTNRFLPAGRTEAHRIVEESSSR